MPFHVLELSFELIEELRPWSLAFAREIERWPIS